LDGFKQKPERIGLDVALTGRIYASSELQKNISKYPKVSTSFADKQNR
jgi:hypothetical protein